MILQYIGFAFSIILAVVGVLCLGVGGHFASKYKDNWLPTPKSVKEHTKYLLLCALSFCSAMFVFLTSMNGFSLDALLSPLFVLVMISCLTMVRHFINLETADFLNKERHNLPIFYAKPTQKIKEDSIGRRDSNDSEEQK